MRRFLLGPVVRLVPVGLCLVAVQRMVCSNYTVDGVVVQVVLALVVGAGAGVGSERGALAGFILGLMYDLGVGTPLGQTALGYGLAGMVAGYVLSITPDPQWWLSAIFCFLGAIIGEGSLPFIHLVTRGDGDLASAIDVRLVEIVLVVAAIATLLSPLFVPLGRWCMAVKRRKWKVIPE